MTGQDNSRTIASARRTRGQEEDTGFRGQQQDNCKQAAGGQEKDKRRTEGWPVRPEDNDRTRGGQDPDTEFSGAASVASCFS